VEVRRIGTLGPREKPSQDYKQEWQVEHVHYSVVGGCGTAEYHKEKGLIKRRRALADKIMPAPRQPGAKHGPWVKAMRGLRKKLARFVNSEDSNVPVALMEAVANRRIYPDPALEGTGVNPEITVQTKERAGRTHTPLKIPIYAGDIVAILRGIHGPLEDTADNRTLIYQDASRRTRALKQNVDPRFKDMRDEVMADVILWASNLFWLKSDALADSAEQLSMLPARKSAEGRQRAAARVRPGKFE
jgi:hypothetical protein